MEPYWWWAIAGIALVIAELITGTFYLLVIGIAALVGAAAAYLNYSFGIQAVIAAAIAIIGVTLVTRFRHSQASAPSVSLDVGRASCSTPGSTSRTGSRACATATRCGTPKCSMRRVWKPAARFTSRAWTVTPCTFRRRGTADGQGLHLFSITLCSQGGKQCFLS
jgi:hypothetical protein